MLGCSKRYFPIGRGSLATDASSPLVLISQRLNEAYISKVYM